MKVISASALLFIMLTFMLAFQSPIEPRVGSLETHNAIQDTRIAGLEILYFTPTPEFIFTPDLTATTWRATDNADIATRVATLTYTETPEFTPTPPLCLQPAKVNAERLNVRDAPGGKVVGTLQNGTAVLYNPSTATRNLGYTFVQLNDGRWVASEFLSSATSRC